jgi:hypothetical protein
MSSPYPPTLHNHDLFLSRNDHPDPTLPENTDVFSPQQVTQFETPGASSSGLSHYNPSELSDFGGEDPFFGAESGSYLEDEHPDWDATSLAANHNTLSSTSAATSETRRNAFGPSRPLTPEQTASIQSASPRSELTANLGKPNHYRIPFSISPQELQKPFKPDPIITQQPQLTPSQSSSGRSSEDGLAPAPLNMQARSPRISVSVWDQDETANQTVTRSFAETSSTLRGGIESAGDLISASYETQQPTSAPRDSMGRWQRDSLTGQAGLDPRNRPADEVPSPNEMAIRQETEERNQDVGKWLAEKLDKSSKPDESSADELRAMEQQRSDFNDDVPLGSETENRVIPNQTYIFPHAGPMDERDQDLLARDQNWADAPRELPIRHSQPGQFQPETSQSAIMRFEKMCRDSDAMSRAATWGTRRRSIHSVADLDMEGILGGGLFKKLSISRDREQTMDRGNKTGSILKDVYAFVRRPSITSLRKRRGSGSGEDIQEEPEVSSPQEKRDSLSSPPHLAPPPDRSSSWGKKNQSGNSMTTAFTNLVNTMGSPTTGSESHARKSSFSGVSPATPAKSGLLKASNTLKRVRSKSEASNTAPPSEAGSTSALAAMWKATGGPPVAALSKPSSVFQAPENEDDDDDDDDIFEDNDMKSDANLIDNVEANFAGFQSHVLMLNPHLDGQYNYLVDRIAQHQVIRYKHLLNMKVKHLNLGANCPCGALCLALGGQANVLDQKGDAKGMDPLATQYIDDDDAGTPIDGVVNQDSFPPDIPLPPTQALPAEFECQLCYTKKKFQKPSDWTKHVHEDVQPFTCTWERCRDAKSFKRKADWVRHENEGHRQLEWWTCDVDECRHTCYRRDNFLQHLVREHKFPEPKVKTKAAIKKAGNLDPTWQRVEKCHTLTDRLPQNEPCRFCGKVFLTWKKLTVHLAKHMEQISLPVLRLVEAKAKEISADTIISPVRDPPPRPLMHMMGQGLGASAGNQGPYAQGHGQIEYPPQGTAFIYPPVMAPGQNMYAPNYTNMGHTLDQQQLGVGSMDHHDYSQAGSHMPHMTPTTLGYGQPTPNYMTVADNSNDGGLEPFPAFDGLGLHNHTHGGAMRPQMGYHGVMDHSTASASPFSGQGSASPYSHSPHLHPTNVDNEWEQRQKMSGYR